MSDRPDTTFNPPFHAGSEAGDFTLADEPFAVFEGWYAEAVARELSDPEAMALATVDEAGVPNLRMVLLKGLDPAGSVGRGFVFFTNLDSAKGRELAAHPNAALLFHWKSLRRQARIRGAVTEVSAREADAYFESRPYSSRVGAWASRQSRPLASRRALEKAVAAYEAKFMGLDVPRPPRWSGFRLAPMEMEFWRDRPFRLHDRIVFRRDTADGEWTKTRLYP